MCIRSDSVRGSFANLSKILKVHEQVLKKWRRDGLLGEFDPKAPRKKGALVYGRKELAMMIVGSWMKWLYPGKKPAQFIEAAMRRLSREVYSERKDNQSTILLIQKDEEGFIQSKVFTRDLSVLEAISEKLGNTKNIGSLEEVLLLDVIKSVWINVSIIEDVSVEIIQEAIDRGSVSFQEFEKNFSKLKTVECSTRTKA